MKPNTGQPKAPEAAESKAPALNPGSRPEPKNDLKSLPMPELEQQLGSSPEGLTPAEALSR
jgi:H+-transporting ATPase